ERSRPRRSRDGAGILGDDAGRAPVRRVRADPGDRLDVAPGSAARAGDAERLPAGGAYRRLPLHGNPRRPGGFRAGRAARPRAGTPGAGAAGRRGVHGARNAAAVERGARPERPRRAPRAHLLGRRRGGVGGAPLAHPRPRPVRARRAVLFLLGRRGRMADDRRLVPEHAARRAGGGAWKVHPVVRRSPHGGRQRDGGSPARPAGQRARGAHLRAAALRRGPAL
ncbi:MAG: hypothetical protein AVDCRST_MAG89-2857, partial [uncultured Gemmatimonadetes bacterium]